MKISLIGYMGSGKTRVGASLAQVLDWEFVDLDDYIERQSGVSIGDFFKDYGAIKFRKYEREMLENLINNDKDMVISLGGGTPCYYDTMNYLLELKDHKSIYLKTSIPTLVNRLKEEKSHRPLIANLNSDQELAEFIGKHLFERSHIYAQAQFTLSTDQKSPDQIVHEIVSGLF